MMLAWVVVVLNYHICVTKSYDKVLDDNSSTNRPQSKSTIYHECVLPCLRNLSSTQRSKSVEKTVLS